LSSSPPDDRSASTNLGLLYNGVNLSLSEGEQERGGIRRRRLYSPGVAISNHVDPWKSLGSLDDEEESDEARGGSTENEAKRRSHQEMRPRKKGKGKGKRRGTERQGEKKRSELKE